MLTLTSTSALTSAPPAALNNRCICSIFASHLSALCCCAMAPTVMRLPPHQPSRNQATSSPPQIPLPLLLPLPWATAQCNYFKLSLTASLLPLAAYLARFLPHCPCSCLCLCHCHCPCLFLSLCLWHLHSLFSISSTCALVFPTGFPLVQSFSYACYISCHFFAAVAATHLPIEQ